MVKATRGRILLLALLITISHVALAAHAATHTDPGSVPCQLCIGQAQQAHGLPSSVFHCPVVHGELLRTHAAVPVAPDLTVVRLFLQRGPPSSLC